MKPKIKIKRTFDRSCNGGNRKDTKRGYNRAIRRNQPKIIEIEK